MTSASDELLFRVFGLWDRIQNGDITTEELRKYKTVAEIMEHLSASELNVAKSEAVRTDALIRYERAQLPPGRPTLSAGDCDDTIDA